MAEKVVISGLVDSKHCDYKFEGNGGDVTKNSVHFRLPLPALNIC